MPVLLTNHVPLSRIKIDDSRSKYDPQLIEDLAQLILQGEGLISPLIIEQESTLLTFRLVSGFLEYHAAMRAREIDPRKGESIQAFIIGVDFEEARKKALETQIRKIRQAKDIMPPVSLPDAVSQALSSLEARLSNLSDTVTQKIDAIGCISEDLRKSIAVIEGKINSLDSLIAITPPKFIKDKPSLPDSSTTPALEPKIKININDPNLSIADLSKINGIAETTAKRILEFREEKGGKFNLINDLREMGGVGKATLTKWTTPSLSGAVLVCEDV